jgi:hypothetical protein
LKYAFIRKHRQVWPITVQCRVLRVSVAGYHEHIVRRASDAPRRYLSDEALLVHSPVFPRVSIRQWRLAPCAW